MADLPKPPKIDFKAPEDLEYEMAIETISSLSASALDVLKAISRDFHRRLVAWEASSGRKMHVPFRIMDLRKDIAKLEETARHIEARQRAREWANAEPAEVEELADYF